MAADERSCDVAATFVRLADTLVDDYDVVDFASTLSQDSLRLLDSDAAGVMLVAGPDELRILASTSEEARALELFEMQSGEGPSIDTYLTGGTVDVSNLASSCRRWERYTRFSLRSGFHAVSAIPMVVRQHRIGVLNLFSRAPRALSAKDLVLAECLANVASVGILSAQRVREEHVVAEQLQGALASRVVIEQAKGVLAERLGVHVDEAFAVMRRYARANRQLLSDVASDVVAGHRLDDGLQSVPAR